jgi:CopG family transcriptional regulator, nickel-responsive regulator
MHLLGKSHSQCQTHCIEDAKTKYTNNEISKRHISFDPTNIWYYENNSRVTLLAPSSHPPRNARPKHFAHQETTMSDLSRTGVSLDSVLLEQFDQLIQNKGYANRSEALRDLIRDHLVATSVVAPDAEVVGTVTLIYDHHSRLLPEKLTDIQHKYHEAIISTVHAHLDHDTCLEVVVVKGKSKQIQNLADLLISTKGVQHGRLVMSSPAIAHSSAKSNHKHRRTSR